MGKDTIDRTFGIITDDGGPDTNYLSGVTSTTHIYPYCADTITLRPNTNYICNITTGFSYEERVKAWIDFNDDKTFDSIAELFYDSTGLINHGGTVNFDSTLIPQSIYGKKVMMRLMSDYSANPEPMPCSNLVFGDVLDLMVGIERYLPLSVNDIEKIPYTDFHAFSHDNMVDINYNLKTKSKTSIFIYDITGNVIYSIENNVQSAGHQHQSLFIGVNGFYFVELISEGYKSVKKIIMN